MKKITVLLFSLPFLIFGVSNVFAAGEAEESVSVMTSMGGQLLEAFETVIGNFSEETGYDVRVEVVDDISTLLVTRAEAGNLPDVVQLAKPGQMEDFAKEGKLVELDKSIVSDHPEGFVELGTVDGELYGIFLDASLKSLIWYSPKNFDERGYEIPETWDELMELTDEMAANGDTPWVLGMESGGASGWPGTDWLEDIILRMHGTEFYDQWVNHEIGWDDPRIKEAWEMFGEIFKTEDYVLGGDETIVSLAWNEAANYMFTDPANAYMYKQGTFVQAFIQDNNPGLVPGEDYSVFALPPIKEEVGNPLMGAGDIVFAFTDKPEVKELLAYLASAEAQQVMAETGQGLAVNKNVPLDVYPDPINAKAAEILKSSTNFRFDGSDLMPAAVGSGSFWTGMMDYFSGEDLDTILGEIEKSAERAYK